jgi:hypothetical protein
MKMLKSKVPLKEVKKGTSEKTQNENLISSKDLLTLLKKQDIQSLEDFTEKVAPCLNADEVKTLIQSRTPSKPKLITPEMLRNNLLHEVSETKEHQPPPLPFQIEGKKYNPENIEKFDGEPLYYYIDQNILDQGFIQAFSDKSKYFKYLEKVGMIPKDFLSDNNQITPKHSVGGTPSKFYEHVKYGGHVLTLDPRHAIDDLSRVRMSGYLWWQKSWNDRISSLKTGSEGAWLYEHADFGGHYLPVGKNTSMEWIGSTWNDRVSSIMGPLF